MVGVVAGVVGVVGREARRLLLRLQQQHQRLLLLLLTLLCVGIPIWTARMTLLATSHHTQTHRCPHHH
jgi:hypothetical protein